MKISSTYLKPLATTILWFNLVIFSGCAPTTPQLPQPLTTVSLSDQLYGPGETTANPLTGYVYVLSYSGHVAVFKDTQLQTVLKVGDQARAKILSVPEQDRIYALNEYSDSVSIIQGTQVITTLAVGGRLPTDIAYDKNTNHVYVVTGNAPGINLWEDESIQGNLTVIGEDKVISIVPLEETFAQHLEIDPIYNYIYVGAAGGDVVVLKDHQEVARYKGDYTMDSMDIDLRTGDVYFLALASDGINFNRLRQGKLIERLDIKREGGTVDALQVHPTTGDIYVIDVLLREVIVIRPAADAGQGLSIIGRVPVGNGPSRMAIDPNTGNVYVANIFDNSVTAIQGTEVLTTYQVGWYPYGIGVNPANGWVYVANTNENSISILGFK